MIIAFKNILSQMFENDKTDWGQKSNKEDS